MILASKNWDRTSNFHSNILARSTAYMYNYRIAYGVCVVYPSLIFTLLCGRESYPCVHAHERTFCINEVYLYKLNIPFCSNTFIRHTRARTHSVPIHWNRAIYFTILCVCAKAGCLSPAPPLLSLSLSYRNQIQRAYTIYMYYRSYNLLSCWIYNKCNR